MNQDELPEEAENAENYKYRVDLPCKIGDTLFYWTEDFDDMEHHLYVGTFRVRGIQIMPDGIYVFDGDHWDKIGTQFAYLTRAEAEAAIEKEKAK